MATFNIVLTCLLVHLGADVFPERFRQPIDDSHGIRQEQHTQIERYLQSLMDEAYARPQAIKMDYSSPDTYATSQTTLRNALEKRTGYPPPHGIENPVARVEEIGTDGYARLLRVWVEVMPGVEAYGILAIPAKNTEPAPLMICQHGGGGNPELIHGFHPDDNVGSGNYGWFVQRALDRGYVTWSPGLLFPYGGKEEFEGPARAQLDSDLRYVGTSILAIELWKIARSLDVILQRPEVDPERVGMMGLSYGGLYTLWATAFDPRIKVAVSSCYFNERTRYHWGDWSFFNMLNEFGDAEVAALICPRPFMVEVGASDTLFAIEGARAEAARAKIHWEKLGVPEKFEFIEHDGGHEFRGDTAFEFVDAVLYPAPNQFR